MRTRRPPPRRSRKLLVEVVGVAGAGKSTLARALTGDGVGAAVLADTLRTSDIRNLPAVLRGLPGALLVAVASLARRRPLSWVECKAVLYLAGYGPTLSAVGDPGQVVVADQGPAYSLARLVAAARPVTAVGPRTSLWARWLDRWSARLDLVVVLDAPTPVLVERIDRRTRDHEVKGVDAATAARFVAAYRDAYDEVVAGLARRGTAVLRIDTDVHDPSEVARLARAAVDDARVEVRP